MGSIESQNHTPGIRIYRGKGQLTSDEFEKWRKELDDFIKENEKRGGCGILIDVLEVSAFSTEAVDAVMELLSEPDDVLKGPRIRLALIGVKPFTQRFLKESLAEAELDQVRARFFHEVAEKEALAWLQAMIKSIDTKPEEEEADKKEEKPEAEESSKADKKEKEKAKPAAEEKSSGAARLRGLLGVRAGAKEKEES